MAKQRLPSSHHAAAVQHSERRAQPVHGSGQRQGHGQPRHQQDGSSRPAHLQPPREQLRPSQRSAFERPEWGALEADGTRRQTWKYARNKRWCNLPLPRRRVTAAILTQEELQELEKGVPVVHQQLMDSVHIAGLLSCAGLRAVKQLSTQAPTSGLDLEEVLRSGGASASQPRPAVGLHAVLALAWAARTAGAVQERVQLLSAAYAADPGSPRGARSRGYAVEAVAPADCRPQQGDEDLGHRAEPGGEGVGGLRRVPLDGTALAQEGGDGCAAPRAREKRRRRRRPRRRTEQLDPLLQQLETLRLAKLKMYQEENKYVREQTRTAELEGDELKALKDSAPTRALNETAKKEDEDLDRMMDHPEEEYKQVGEENAEQETDESAAASDEFLPLQNRRHPVVQACAGQRQRGRKGQEGARRRRRRRGRHAGRRGRPGSEGKGRAQSAAKRQGAGGRSEEGRREANTRVQANDAPDGRSWARAYQLYANGFDDEEKSARRFSPRSSTTCASSWTRQRAGRTPS